jgi:hypothetical protein
LPRPQAAPSSSIRFESGPGPWPGSPLPVDNLAGIAIELRNDERITVRLISDENHAVTQPRLLWKLPVDPVQPHQTSKSAQGRPRALCMISRNQA